MLSIGAEAGGASVLATRFVDGVAVARSVLDGLVRQPLADVLGVRCQAGVTGRVPGALVLSVAGASAALVDHQSWHIRT